MRGTLFYFFIFFLFFLHFFILLFFFFIKCEAAGKKYQGGASQITYMGKHCIENKVSHKEVFEFAMFCSSGSALGQGAFGEVYQGNLAHMQRDAAVLSVAVKVSPPQL